MTFLEFISTIAIARWIVHAVEGARLRREVDRTRPAYLKGIQTLNTIKRELEEQQSSTTEIARAAIAHAMRYDNDNLSSRNYRAAKAHRPGKH